MNYIELINKFFAQDLEYSFTPLGVTIYFRLLDRCNSLAWKNPFGFACDELQTKIRCKNAESKKAFDTARNRLKQAGLIQFEKGNGRGCVTKYTIKGIQKGVLNAPLSAPLSEPLSGSSGSYFIKPKLNETNIPFDAFWDLYDKKAGRKEKLMKKWESLTDDERSLAVEHIPKYKIATPDKQFRKNPETYLSNKSFNDEIIEAKMDADSSHQANNGNLKDITSRMNQAKENNKKYELQK